MAWLTTRTLPALAGDAVLIPERYAPARTLPWSGTPLGDLAAASGRLIKQAPAPACIFDTSHVSDGFVRAVPCSPAGRLPSARRELAVGDVVFSRLRTYLRQVGWLDPALAAPTGALLLGSPELLALRSTDGRSVAFLVPFLLSAPVQAAFAAAQEGSQHPRVPRDFLLQLPVPDAVLRRRAETSAAVERAIAQQRSGAATLAALAARPPDGGSG